MRRAAAFDQRFSAILDSFTSGAVTHGALNCFTLCDLRDRTLRELGFEDCFK